MKIPLRSALLWLAVLFSTGGTEAQEVFINELHYDNSGTDADEGIEIAGPAGTASFAG